MDKNKDVMEQIESLMQGIEDKEQLLHSLVVRNSKDIFDFISILKWSQDKGYCFGVTHSPFSDLISDPSEFIEKCQQYQFGETGSGREFCNDFRKVIEEEINY